MGELIWLLTSCIFIGLGIAHEMKFILGIGVAMYLIPFGMAVLIYLSENC